MENPDIKTNEQLLTEIEQLKKKVAKLDKVEQELHATKSRYNDFINSSSDAVGYWKMPKGLKTNLPIKDQIEMLCQMVCLDANKACWKGKGLKSKEDAIGKKYIDLIKNKKADDSFTQFIKNNYQLNNHEFYQTFPDGLEHYSLENWHGVIKNGALTHLWASSKDITERIKAEESNKRYKQMIEKSLNEIYLFDTKTYKFIDVNNAAQNNLGYTGEELKKLTPLDIKPDYDINSFNKLVRPLKEKKEKKIIFLYKSQEKKWVAISCRSTFTAQ